MIDMKMIASADAATPGAGRSIFFAGTDGRIRAKLAGGLVIDPLKGDKGDSGLKGDTGDQGLPATARIWPSSSVQLGIAVEGVASPGRLMVENSERQTISGMAAAGTVVVDSTGRGNLQLRVLAGGLVFLFPQIPLNSNRRVYFEFEVLMIDGGAAFGLVGQASEVAGTAIALTKISALSITGAFEGSPLVEARLISAGLKLTPRMANLAVRV